MRAGVQITGTGAAIDPMADHVLDQADHGLPDRYSPTLIGFEADEFGVDRRSWLDLDEFKPQGKFVQADAIEISSTGAIRTALRLAGQSHDTYNWMG